MLLGEARSKCDHLRFVPLAWDTARELQKVYLAKGVFATTSIEGNTLSEEQVRERMEKQLQLPVSQEYMGREIDNMVAAYNDIVVRAMDGQCVSLSIETLKQFNRLILEGTSYEPDAVPGELRQHSVAAGPYLAAPWVDIEHLLTMLCDWINGPSFRPPDEASRVPYAFIKAVTAHIYIEWIHPFGDGNGRLGRLVEFLVLVSGGVPIPAAHILTSHYNETRNEYYRQLHVASRNGGDLRPFLAYAAQGWVDGLTAAIKKLHRQQELLMWQSIVDQAFDGLRPSPTKHRQRLLARTLGNGTEWLTRQQVRVLTPELAEEYAGMTTKAVTRDLNDLRQMGFIRTDDAGRYRADLNLVRGMRPFAFGDG
jgi:Fic family protein